MRPAVVVLGFARTPFGKFGGTLRALSLIELGRIAVQGALSRSGLSPDAVDEVAIGVNFPGSERSVARQVSLRAGIPPGRPAYSVDVACCSSLAAIGLVSRGVVAGETAVAVAGGAENLSQVPFFLTSTRWGNNLGDITLTDQLVISCPHTGVPRAVQAGEEALGHGIGRQLQDEWALSSQNRYASALSKGYFDDELTTVDASAGAERVFLDHDEVPRPDSSMDKLARLPTIYGSPTVTAGNAPNLSSGASALVIGSATDADTQAVLATLHSWTMLAGEPANIASIPAVAGRRALQKAGLTVHDVDIIEINEAFAAVPLLSTLILADGDVALADKLRERTNVNGGALAVGHPTGATGARLVMTAIGELRRRGGGRALVTICGGIGEAAAVIVEVGSGG